MINAWQSAFGVLGACPGNHGDRHALSYPLTNYGFRSVAGCLGIRVACSFLSRSPFTAGIRHHGRISCEVASILSRSLVRLRRWALHCHIVTAFCFNLSLKINKKDYNQLVHLLLINQSNTISE